MLPRRQRLRGSSLGLSEFKGSLREGAVALGD